MGSNIPVILLLTNAAHKWPGTQKNYTKLNKDGEKIHFFSRQTAWLFPTCVRENILCHKRQKEKPRAQ